MGKAAQRRVKIFAYRGYAQRVADNQPPLVTPGDELRQPQDSCHTFRIKADRRRELPDVALEASVADVTRHECVGNTQTLVAVAQVGDLKERSQLNAAQFAQRLIHGGHLVIGQAVAAAMAGEVLGHSRHPAIAPAVDTANISTSHVAHPEGVAAKGAHADIPSPCRARVVEHVHAGPQQQVDAHRGQLAAHDLAQRFSVLQIPRRTHGHRAGQRRRPAGNTCVGPAVALVVNSNHKGHRRMAQRQVLELVGQRRHLARRRLVIDKILVGGQQHHATDLVLDDQLGDVGVVAHVGPDEGHDEELPHPLLNRHAGQQLIHRVGLGRRRAGHLCQQRTQDN